MPKRRVPTFGAYAANEPWPDLSAHYALERLVGHRLSSMSWFQSWDTGWLTSQAAAAAASGHNVVICWEAMRAGEPIRFADVLSGAHDTYLRRYFTEAASFPRPVTIRPFHEMNGNWYPWALANGDTRCVTSTEEWIATWRHLVSLQRSVSGTRVQWAWCPNNVDVGGVRAEEYYPGSAFVDVLALDGYNGYTSWASPHQVIAPMYQRITALHTTAPVMVGEIASREANTEEQARGLSKAQWLSDLFTETRLTRLRHVNYFHADREFNWRLDSSPSALAAARRHVS